MRLTSYTDYALRTLIFLGLNRDRLVTIQDIAELHGISKNHLMKVVHQLGVTGMVDTVRGRNGGMRLKREPADINIGEVVRNTETDFYMAECFDPDNVGCAYSSSCGLPERARRRDPGRHAAQYQASCAQDQPGAHPPARAGGGLARQSGLAISAEVR
jgi:Rrf2 family nitric oxide-sensitive transcriptional repressor